MQERLAALVMAAALAGCAALTPDGRGAAPDGTSLPAAASQAAPQPQPQQQPPEAPVAAPDVSVETPAPPAPRSGDDDIVVRGQQDIQVQPPRGDPRSNLERREDVQAWDQCVTRAQAMGERDPTRPQLDSPEDICSRTLGMAGREAVPDFRRR